MGPIVRSRSNTQGELEDVSDDVRVRDELNLSEQSTGTSNGAATFEDPELTLTESEKSISKAVEAALKRQLGPILSRQAKQIKQTNELKKDVSMVLRENQEIKKYMREASIRKKEEKLTVGKIFTPEGREKYHEMTIKSMHLSANDKEEAVLLKSFWDDCKQDNFITDYSAEAFKKFKGEYHRQRTYLRTQLMNHIKADLSNSNIEAAIELKGTYDFIENGSGFLSESTRLLILAAAYASAKYFNDHYVLSDSDRKFKKSCFIEEKQFWGYVVGKTEDYSIMADGEGEAKELLERVLNEAGGFKASK